MIENLKYVPLSSIVNPSFWRRLTEIKIDVDKLVETRRHVWGYFSLIRSGNVNFPFLEVESTSFNEIFDSQQAYIPFDGQIINKNTIEQFKESDKMDLLNSCGARLLEKVFSGEILKHPYLLNSFLILTFADLKKYNFYYWFAFPVPKDIVVEKIDSQNIEETIGSKAMSTLNSEFKSLDSYQKACFLVKIRNDDLSVVEFSEIKNITVSCVQDILFAFVNISLDSASIGTQLRNYIMALTHYCPFLENSTQRFIALQCTRIGSQITLNQSTVYTLRIPNVHPENAKNWVGWEKNERDKMGPRMANMRNTMDPIILAENSVDLNLKLMKWRLVPQIDLDIMKTTSCLLLGSGTLGCSVARCLLSWGFRDITFVDNSTVSLSNPVRQSLFTYEDSVKMRPKSEAAAARLKEIFPGVKAKGIQLNIPMPGHSIGESMIAETNSNIEALKNLIQQADIVFLLTDSRESRWYPTLLGSFFNKIVITAALGFDSYLILRHGCRKSNTVEPPQSQSGYKTIAGANLGCYFCNDVTAPGDSTKNRSLDQQCTVTRPGVSQIAGALAVELAVSVLQHKERLNAPAIYNIQKLEEIDAKNEDKSILGLVPHSIRGFLSSFNQIMPATLKYNQCVSCSELIMKEYEENNVDFLMKVFNTSKHLEDVTKLTDMFKNLNMDEIYELEDELSE